MNQLTKHVSSYLLICIGLLSCNNKVNKSTIYEPPLTSFRYYNPFFESEPASKLNTRGIYYRLTGEDTFGDQYQFFKFYSDGFVLEYNVYSTPDEVLKLERTRKGNIHGFYKMVNDSIFFSTKVYYEHASKEYEGIVEGDSLMLDNGNWYYLYRR